MGGAGIIQFLCREHASLGISLLSGEGSLVGHMSLTDTLSTLPTDWTSWLNSDLYRPSVSGCDVFNTTHYPPPCTLLPPTACQYFILVLICGQGQLSSGSSHWDTEVTPTPPSHPPTPLPSQDCVHDGPSTAVPPTSDTHSHTYWYTACTPIPCTLIPLL